LVHIGHALAGGLRFTRPVSSDAPAQFSGSPQPRQKAISSSPLGHGQTQAAAEIDKADEKLAPLVKKAKGNRDA